ncbi:MAG: glycosyltransferase [Anaerolineae bacterium]|nr:glycosyltransferase [Anaerolineae bacterium]
MRILFLSQLVPFPIDAGPKVRSYHVLQYLCSVGHEVTLVAFERESDKVEDIAHLRKFCTAVYTVPMVRSRMKDAWYLGQSVLKGEPFLIVRDGVDGMFQLIQSLMREQHFDTVHADQLWMAQYALAARSYLNGNGSQLKLVLDQHNAVYLIPERLASDSSNPVKRLILGHEAQALHRYELDTCARFDDVVWVTDEDRQALSIDATQLIGDLTIPICVDTEEKAVVSRFPGAKRVMFLGGLHWPPNAEGVLWFAREVWPQIVAEMPEAILTVIGKAPPGSLQSVENPIPNLDVTGYVDDVTSYLAETAVFIVPLHAGGGMRVKIIDAWSWGLPIVSTSIGAEGVQYRDGENLLIGDSAHDFATAVLKLMQDRNLADSIAGKGRLTAETTYEWRNVYRAWDKVYD